MGNGFVTESQAQLGSLTSVPAANYAYAQKFTTPVGCTGAYSFGCWVSSDGGAQSDFKYGIFTDDAVNANPNALVANSDAVMQCNNANAEKQEHVYDPQPALDAETVYWLCVMTEDNTLNWDRIASTGGVTVRKNTGFAYPDFPTPTNWDAAGDRTDNMGFWVVYTSGEPPASILPLVGFGTLGGNCNPMMG